MDPNDDRQSQRDEGTTLTKPAAFAANTEYVAFAGDHGIYIESSSSKKRAPYCLYFESGRTRFKPVLAFSQTRLSLLAAAVGQQVLIFDVAAKKAQCVLKGNGRVVTSIAFASEEPVIVATGAVDGSICLWSLKQASRPLRQLRGITGACTNLAFSPCSNDVLAACHQSKVSVWQLSDPRPLAILSLESASIQLLSWCVSDNETVLAVSKRGVVTVFTMSPGLISKVAQTPRSLAEDFNDDFQFPDILETIKPTEYGSVRNFALHCSVQQANLLGRDGLIVLAHNTNTLYFYSHSSDQVQPTELWRLKISSPIRQFALHASKTSVDAIVYDGESTQRFEIPAAVLDAMGWSSTISSLCFPTMDGNPLQDTTPRIATMHPEKASRTQLDNYLPIGQLHQERGAKVALEPVRNMSKKLVSRTKKWTAKRDLPASAFVKPNTEILEMDDIGDSPMPFLSPSIPARKVSPNSIAQIDEIIELPPRVSLDSIFSPTTPVHDSDSDDEAFADHMQGSGSYLSAAVNVPRPRSCGASFSQNGQLLIFLPAKAKIPTVHDGLEGKQIGSGINYSSKISKLFPSFANLPPVSKAQGNAEDSVGSLDDLSHHIPTFAIQEPSFNSQPSWTARISPIKPSPTGLPGLQSVNISVRELGQLTPARRNLAERYRLSGRGKETDTDLCNGNSDIAAEEGLSEASDAWNLLALILEQRSGDQFGSFLDQFALVDAFRAQRPFHSRNTSIGSSVGRSRKGRRQALRQWPQHPLGNQWAIEQLFSWAEHNADIQLLASMSAILTRATEALSKRGEQDHRQELKLSAARLGTKLAVAETTVVGATRLPQKLPILHSNAGSRLSGESPPKAQSSRTSSKHPSQPTTPYVESSASTSPMMLPSLYRQNSSRLSISGSASPEHHRNSFGVAARNYAASIAEKFSSYGSSPPTKRLSTSPGKELSSSLPNGSWSKSVSFASTITGNQSIHRSLSLAQEDENYDSDTTIDNINSSLHTSKGQSADVIVTMKKDQFFDETSVSLSGPLLSSEFATKSFVWRRCYAEQLRSWGLMLQAAEMENVQDISAERHTGTPQQVNVLPGSANGERRPACSICFCKIHAAEQLCPACLHATHPTCLENLMLESDHIPFRCPTGCGCECTSAADVSFALVDDIVETDGKQTKRLFLKRPSLTDPLRLRQRLQGESW